ncbi:putative transporter [Lachnellula suecica]|uniref:Putative transporter n=1 Tax=Lachnellula suecica TaxID=602035 RepID=A0A8T9CE20_9HELO|nr:putative transporter [Lachnellula suecica]
MAMDNEVVKHFEPSTTKEVESDNFQYIKKGDVIDIAVLDEAEAFLRDHGYDWAHVHALLQNEDLSKGVLRKIDWQIMPLLCGTFMLQYIDKSSLAYGAVFDLFKNANISSAQYSWLASLFYFGYLFFEYPGSFLGQHFPTGKVVGIDV